MRSSRPILALHSVPWSLHVASKAEQSSRASACRHLPWWRLHSSVAQFLLECSVFFELLIRKAQSSISCGLVARILFFNLVRSAHHHAELDGRLLTPDVFNARTPYGGQFSNEMTIPVKARRAPQSVVKPFGCPKLENTEASICWSQPESRSEPFPHQSRTTSESASTGCQVGCESSQACSPRLARSHPLQRKPTHRVCSRWTTSWRALLRQCHVQGFPDYRTRKSA